MPSLDNSCFCVNVNDVYCEKSLLIYFFTLLFCLAYFLALNYESSILIKLCLWNSLVFFYKFEKKFGFCYSCRSQLLENIYNDWYVSIQFICFTKKENKFLK